MSGRAVRKSQGLRWGNIGGFVRKKYWPGLSNSAKGQNQWEMEAGACEMEGWLMPDHNSTSCRLCESLSTDAYQRNWKHEPKLGLGMSLPTGRICCQASPVRRTRARRWHPMNHDSTLLPHHLEQLIQGS